MFNHDLLARLHDSRMMVKAVRNLDAEDSAGYRASIVRSIERAFCCGILAPRIGMLTSEMLVFCHVKGYLDRSEDFPAGDACLSVVTPSGRRLNVAQAATRSIKRTITRVNDTPDGRDSFLAENEMFLKVVTRCWNVKAWVSTKPTSSQTQRCRGRLLFQRYLLNHCVGRSGFECLRSTVSTTRKFTTHSWRRDRQRTDLAVSHAFARRCGYGRWLGELHRHFS